MDRRKELKLAYKQTPPPMGVYRITNKINGNSLIGSSMNLPGSKNSNYFQLKTGSHRNKALQADWNLYGSDAFTFDILEALKSEEVSPNDWRKAVTALEDKWLATLQPFDEKGYNKPYHQHRRSHSLPGPSNGAGSDCQGNAVDDKRQ